MLLPAACFQPKINCLRFLLPASKKCAHKIEKGCTQKSERCTQNSIENHGKSKGFCKYRGQQNVKKY